MLPTDQHSGVPVVGLREGRLQLLNVLEAEARINRHSKLDGRRLNRGKRTIIGIDPALIFLQLRRVGRKNEIRFAEFLLNHRRQFQRTVQALTIELPQTLLRLFAMS